MKLIYPILPEGRFKALTLSFDDGHIEDRRLTELFNQYGLHATFNLNSGISGADRIPQSDYAALYAGHEIASHGVLHPGMTMTPLPLAAQQALEDRRTLEHLTQYPVRGFAYPFGESNDAVATMLPAVGIRYARTVADTGKYNFPQDWLRWDPTCHIFNHLLEYGQRFVERANLRKRKRIDVRIAHAHGAAQHATTLQGPIIAGDSKRPLTRELHLFKDLGRQVIAIAQSQIHLGNATVGLGNRHLDIIDKRREQWPFSIGATQQVQVTQLLACGTQAIPRGKVDARLRPAKDPRNRTQVVKRFRAQAALCRAAADRQQANLGQRRYRREPRGKIVGTQQVQITLMGRPVQALSHVGEFFRHARIGTLDAWRRIEQRRRGNALYVPLSKRLVPVTRKDDLALLGHLKEAVHRSRRLRQHGTVCRAAAATHSAATTVHEHKVDTVLLGPVGDALLRRVQRERRRGGTGIL